MAGMRSSRAHTSTVLGCTRAAFSMRLSRAKRRLAKHVGPVSDLPIAFANLNGAS